MRPETRDSLFNLSIDEVRDQLGLSARAVVACVEQGLLEALLPSRGLAAPELDDARFRGDQVERLKFAPAELASFRERFPLRTRGYDRAVAMGALLTALGR